MSLVLVAKIAGTDKLSAYLKYSPKGISIISHKIGGASEKFKNRNVLEKYRTLKNHKK
jgi:hypothetical protein